MATISRCVCMHVVVGVGVHVHAMHIWMPDTNLMYHFSEAIHLGF